MAKQQHRSCHTQESDGLAQLRIVRHILNHNNSLVRVGTHAFPAFGNKLGRDGVATVAKLVMPEPAHENHLADALKAAVLLSPYRDAANPVAWQREFRSDGVLPGRD